MSEHSEVRVDLELVDGFEFRVAFSGDGVQLVMDEPEPMGSGHGPNAASVLSAAIGNCLSASLLFCLRRAKIEPSGLGTTVTTSLIRNEKGRLRVGDTRVAIRLEGTLEDSERIERCLELFEDYCIVTQSVRRGIDVQVAVLDPAGTELYRSSPDASSSIQTVLPL